jgi:hypothetical protein
VVCNGHDAFPRAVQDTMMIFNSNCDLRRTLEMVAEVYPDKRIQRQDIIVRGRRLFMPCVCL